MAMRRVEESGLSTAQFVAAMEHSPIGTALVGLDGGWLWVNSAICDTLGYSRDELRAVTFQDITHPDDLDADIGHVGRLLRGDVSAYQMDKRYVRKDGSTVWCSLAVTLVRGADGKADYFISTVQDISERKALELERAVLTERLTLATHAGGVGVWDWDIATNALIWDERMFELYGIDRAVAPDYSTFLDAVDPDHRERVDGLLKAAIDGSARYDTEFPIQLPDGETRQLRALAEVEHDAAGRPVRMIGTNWDVTEHRRLVSLAEQAARSKSEFLATISHELRTPLNSIIGFSRLVLDDEGRGETPLPATARRYVELVRDASTTLHAIVDDVLDYSRIEAGGFELAPAPFQLRQMVENAIEIVRAGAEQRGLALSLTIGEEVPRLVIGDHNRLRQILLNLMGNAIKFTASGGVEVSVALDPDSAIRWAVRDTGIGIAPDKQHLLFKRFSQVDQSIARRFGGSGLGLAICERLASAMGGTIGVDSAPGEGSCFWFTTSFPEVATLTAEPSPETSTRARPPRTVAPQRILLAEDFELNQLLAVALLEKAGHEVIVVANGSEALERVQAERFDLVLMDVQMPVMDGIEATRRIRALGGGFRALPIIALTANVMPDDIARFRDNGMDDHIGKPIPEDAFDRIVERWGGAGREEVAYSARFAKGANARP